MFNRVLFLVAIAAIVLLGCKGIPTIDPNPLPSIPIPRVNPNAGQSEAKALMWPFLWAGFLGLLGGLVWAVLFKNMKPLMYAGLIALVPPAFFLFLEPFTIYVGILALLSGLVLFGFLFYKVWDIIEDDIYKERQERKNDNAVV